MTYLVQQAMETYNSQLHVYKCSHRPFARSKLFKDGQMSVKGISFIAAGEGLLTQFIGSRVSTRDGAYD